MSNLIEARALEKTYGPRQALRDVTLAVPAGQVVIVLGDNGAGKTVLLKVLAGLLVPDGGSVRLGGYDLVSERALAVPQVAVFLPGLQQVDDECRVGASLPAPEGTAAPFLEALGLEPYRGLAVGALSQGLRQQMLLARVLDKGRPIVLLDEPFRGLDPHAAHALQEWTRHLAHAEARAVVVATSDPHLSQSLGDRLLLLADGRIAADLPLDAPPRLDAPACYRIHVRGRLEPRWSAWFDGLTVTARGEETVISGLVRDQPALHSVLTRIRDLGLLLLAVQRFEAGMERALRE